MPIQHPKKIEDITSEWMTWAFRQAGICQNASVRLCHPEPIGGGYGFVSEIARVTLSFDQKEKELPSTVVVKLPPTSGFHREAGDAFRVYEREVRFYQEISPHSPIRSPRCYFSLLDIESDDFILVLEDVSRYAFGDQVKGLTLDQATAAITTIAPFHAYWWNHPTLNDLTWMPRENMDMVHLFAQNWPKFRGEFSSQLSSEEIAIGDRLNWQGDRLAELLNRTDRTIVHFDYRADNLVFDDLTLDNPVIVLDWQFAQRNSGAFDVARLVCGSLTLEDQDGRHHRFVQHWHGSLLHHGVFDYSFQQAWQDYQTAILCCLYIPVAFHHIPSAEGGRGRKLARAWIHRFFHAAVACEAVSVLSPS